MRKIFFVRHGSIKSNKLKIYAGWSNEELDSEGIKQAHEVGKLLSQYPIKAIYSSPIKRAIQTAEIISTYLPNVNIVIEENLKEMKLGPWEGLSEDEIAKKYPEQFKLWNTKPAELKLPNRETLFMVRDRAIKAIKNMLSDNHSGDLIAVTHVAIIRCLYLHYNNLDLNLYKKIDVPNASIFVYTNSRFEKLIFEK